MATRSGAQALGLADVTGSLEPGKEADVVTVDLRGLHFVPVLHGEDFNVAAHLVFTASSHDVRDVWVQGRRLVENGSVVSVDVGEIAADAQAAAEDLFARRRALVGRTASPATDLGKTVA
jgi:5-methylthioadenosine/S-adenosylhomocysteine deaminase